MYVYFIIIEKDSGLYMTHIILVKGVQGMSHFENTYLGSGHTLCDGGV